MPPRKPAYQTLRISLDEARAEVALLRVQMYRFGCSCKDSEFQRIFDRLSLLLSYIQYKENQEKTERRGRRQPPPSLIDPDHPLTPRPFVKGQSNQKLCLSFCHSLLSHPTTFFCTIYCIEFWFFCQLFLPPNIHSVCQTLAISVLAMFFGCFWSKQYFLPAWGTVSNRPGLFQLGSPVRFSLSQFHIGIT